MQGDLLWPGHFMDIDKHKPKTQRNDKNAKK